MIKMSLQFGVYMDLPDDVKFHILEYMCEFDDIERPNFWQEVVENLDEEDQIEVLQPYLSASFCPKPKTLNWNGEP